MITNEHVVAMMKAAINETEPVPVFVSICGSETLLNLFMGLGSDLIATRLLFLSQEPKMTRSKLKEVVEKGVVRSPLFLSP